MTKHTTKKHCVIASKNLQYNASTSSIKAEKEWQEVKSSIFQFQMTVLPIILFFLSFRGIFLVSIPECPNSKVDLDSTSVNEVKEILEFKGFVLISGKTMKKLLIQHGATEEDMFALESGYIHKHLPIDQQPVMHHRQVNEMQGS